MIGATIVLLATLLIARTNVHSAHASDESAPPPAAHAQPAETPGPP